MAYRIKEGEAPPLCRYCGEPIKKSTHSIHFNQSSPSHSDWSSNNPAKPTSKAEAQKLTNQQIVSVRWAMVNDYDANTSYRDYIYSANTWDGVSYEDQFFHNGDCARKFGYMMARDGGWATTAYNKALAAQKGKIDA